jgi:spermidine synthase
VVVGLLLTALFYTESLEDHVRRVHPESQVRRDHVATTISVGNSYATKMLLVDGIGMTQLTPITKWMAHLPLAFHRGEPESALVICFGMGASYRAALSWDVRTIAVELVPGVKDAFGFYFADAERFRNHPKGRIVVDDGRRYLKRSTEMYDVILLDPPPPAEAAGSSLLYSTEFYELAKQRLNRGGILQAWFPVGSQATWNAVARSLHDAFAHVRMFPSVEGWGGHFLASMEPIEKLSADTLLARIPEQAKADLLEWNRDQDLKSWIEPMLRDEVPIQDLLSSDPRLRITDDRPFNEYYLLRQVALAVRGSGGFIRVSRPVRGEPR